MWAVTLAACACGKKQDKPQTIPAPPAPGGASADVVATNIGNGLALPVDLAPTSTTWSRSIVVDEQTALVAGRTADEAIALTTADGGRSWHSLRAPATAWSTWASGTDGTVVLIAGDDAPKNAAPKRHRSAESARYWLAPPSGKLGEPLALFPRKPHLIGVTTPVPPGGAAVLSAELVSLIVNRGRATLVAFGTPPSTPLPKPLATENHRLVRTPYGHPPQLLTVAGSHLTAQPWPKPGSAIEPGTVIPIAIANARTKTQLDEGPTCDSGAWSFRLVTPSSKAAQVLGVSPTRSIAFPVPVGLHPQIGCRADAIVVAVDSDGKGTPQLIRCTLDGVCATPQNLPFEVWPEPHESTLRIVATEKGVVATLSMRAGARWGVYLAQSMDGGATYELPRVIGEGKTEQGHFDVGAMVGLPGRVLMVLSANVTGSSRRGWYVLASSDGGSNWAPP